MDDKRFDLVAKSLSSGLSRRSLLRSLAAAVGVAALGVDQASAAPGGGTGSKKCYGGGSLCTNAKQCCSGTCTNRVCAPEGGSDPCATKNCDDGNPCTTDSCLAGQCTHTPVASGTPLASQTSGDCQLLICDGNGNVKAQPDDADLPPYDGNMCVETTCYQGNIVRTPRQQGTYCGFAGACDGMGECVPLCANIPAGTPIPSYLQNPGDCLVDVCDGKGGITTQPDDNDLPWDDGNLCIVNTCVMGNVSSSYAPLNTPCATDSVCDGMGTCRPQGVEPACINVAAGTPLPPEYQTDADCRLAVCDGFGNISWKPDDTDVPQYNKPCVNDMCSNGEYTYTIDQPGTACVSIGLDGFCDANGGCVPS